MNLKPSDYHKVQHITVKEYQEKFDEKPSKKFKEIAVKLHAQEAKAIEIIKDLPLFSWNAFEKKYLTNNAVQDTINQAFKDYSLQLRAAGRIGTAVSYECAAKSLDKFSPNAKFIDVTPNFLSRYEKWMLNNGNSVTTVGGIYLRSLRALFNTAIAEGNLNKDAYPFGRRKYEIPAANNKKKALTLADISLIFH